MKRVSQDLIKECRQKLLDAKRDILNRVRDSRREFESLDRSGGDEADQTMRLMAENVFLTAQHRVEEQLL